MNERRGRKEGRKGRFMSKEVRLILQLGIPCIPFNYLFTTSIFRLENHIQKIAIRFFSNSIFKEHRSLDRHSLSCVIHVSFDDLAYVHFTKNTTGKIMV